VAGIAFTHDANGNLTSDGTYSYSYDFRNRLVRAVGPDLVAEYAYDALGRRITKTVSLTSTGLVTSTGYLCDGQQVIEERDENQALVATYIYGVGIDEVLTMRRGGVSYFYHANSIGSIAALTDEAGQVVERYTYDVYGQAGIRDSGGGPITTSGVGNPYTFTGRWLDDETGLLYYRQRYYNPALGRFMTRDPQGYADSLNLYEYVNSNPINRVDPFGLESNTAGDSQNVVQRLKELVDQVVGPIQQGAQRVQNAFREQCANLRAQWLEQNVCLSVDPNACGGIPWYLDSDATELVERLLGGQALLLDPAEAERLREIIGISDRAIQLAQLTRFFQQQLTTQEDLYTSENLDTIEHHLRDRLGAYNDEWAPYNQAMVDRQGAIMRGELEATPYDLNWMQHELMESAMMEAGMEYGEAHSLTKQLQGVEGDWDLWPTEIYQEYRPALGNPRWDEEIGKR
jgi:RHS repeat-associated protein